MWVGDLKPISHEHSPPNNFLNQTLDLKRRPIIPNLLMGEEDMTRQYRQTVKGEKD